MYFNWSFASTVLSCDKSIRCTFINKLSSVRAPLQATACISFTPFFSVEYNKERLCTIYVLNKESRPKIHGLLYRVVSNQERIIVEHERYLIQFKTVIFLSFLWHVLCMLSTLMKIGKALIKQYNQVFIPFYKLCNPKNGWKRIVKI